MGTSKVEGNFFTGEMNFNVSSCYPLFCNQISSIFYHTVWQIYFSQKVQFTKRYLSHCNWISKILRIVIFKYFFLIPREMGVIMSCYCRYCVVFLALQGFFLFGFTRM